MLVVVKGKGGYRDVGYESRNTHEYFSFNICSSGALMKAFFGFFACTFRLKHTHTGCWSLTESLTEHTKCLAAEAVKGLSLAFQGVDNVHGSDGLSAGVFGVGDGITDDGFQEHLQDTTGFFVDQTRDALDTTTASKTTDGGLGDTLDVITQNLAVTLGTTFTQTFSSFTTSRHVLFLK